MNRKGEDMKAQCMKRLRFLAIAMAVGVLGASTTVFAVAPSLEARKELNAIGVRYDDTREFFKAAKQKNWDLVRIFLDAKGVTVESTSDGKRLLDQALDDGDTDLRRFLLKIGAVPSAYQLERQIRFGQMDVAEELLQASGFNKAQISPSVIVAAIDSKDLALVRRLLTLLGTDAKRVLDSRIDPINSGTTRMLNYVLYTSSTETLKVLIEHGADVNAVDARLSLSPSSALIIISTPSRPYKTPETPLMLAAALHDGQAVRLLLDAGAELNKVLVQEGKWLGVKGRENALSYARKYDEKKDKKGMKEAVIQMLIAAGAKSPDELK